MKVSAISYTVSFSLFSLLASCSQDYYAQLGVERNASPTDIKKAFRRMARIYHPDRNKDKKVAEAKFIKLTKAYEVLSDKNKRQQYDVMGHDAFEQNMAHGNDGGADSNFQHFTFDEVFKKFFPEEHDNHGGFHFSFGSNMFGGHDHESFHNAAHQRAHQEAHQRAQQAHFGSFDSFFGNDFHDIHSGGGNSFFGQAQQSGDDNYDHDDHNHDVFSSGFGFGDGFSNDNENEGGQRCRTITRTEGGMTSVYTECS